MSPISYDPRAMEQKRLNAERIENRSLCKPDKPQLPGILSLVGFIGFVNLLASLLLPY